MKHIIQNGTYCLAITTLLISCSSQIPQDGTCCPIPITETEDIDTLRKAFTQEMERQSFLESLLNRLREMCGPDNDLYIMPDNTTVCVKTSRQTI